MIYNQLTEHKGDSGMLEWKNPSMFLFIGLAVFCYIMVIIFGG